MNRLYNLGNEYNIINCLQNDPLSEEQFFKNLETWLNNILNESELTTVNETMNSVEIIEITLFACTNVNEASKAKEIAEKLIKFWRE